MWAYARFGTSLPRSPRAQYNGTIHTPLGDIAPGDILFCGPRGSENEAMYIGADEMVEAGHPGSNVTGNPIRTGNGFVRVGRIVYVDSAMGPAIGPMIQPSRTVRM
ncbi:MAG: NlpC/P60 family protein [Acidimicrobiales bacterium]